LKLMSCYRPARHYLSAGVVAAGLAVFSAWCGTRWWAALIPAVLFVFSSLILSYLGTRPVIEVDDRELRIGSSVIAWEDVVRIDSTAWSSPLVLQISLRDGSRIRLIYPGDVESAGRLLRQMRRSARRALIDGLSYSQYWGEVLPVQDRPKPPAPPRYRLLRPEDESEVEELYQRLKTVGRLDQHQSQDDHGD
jgi:hypothetical protein